MTSRIKEIMSIQNEEREEVSGVGELHKNVKGTSPNSVGSAHSIWMTSPISSLPRAIESCASHRIDHISCITLNNKRKIS